MREAFRTSTFAKIGYLFASGAWIKLRKRVDPRRYNGGVFLGLDGVCVKSHGGTDQLGFAYAIGVAVDLVRYEYKNKLVEGLAKLRQVTSAAEAPPPALQASGGARVIRSVVQGCGAYLPDGSSPTTNWPRRWIPRTSGSSSAPAFASATSRPTASSPRIWPSRPPSARWPMPALKASDLDLIVLATATPDETFPGHRDARAGRPSA